MLINEFDKEKLEHHVRLNKLTQQLKKLSSHLEKMMTSCDEARSSVLSYEDAVRQCFLAMSLTEDEQARRFIQERLRWVTSLYSANSSTLIDEDCAWIPSDLLSPTTVTPHILQRVTLDFQED